MSYHTRRSRAGAESMSNMSREEAQRVAEREMQQANNTSVVSDLTRGEPVVRVQTPGGDSRPTPESPPRPVFSRQEIEESRVQAERESVELFGRTVVHQMPNGLFMPGPDHETYEAVIRDQRIREEQQESTDPRDARTTREIAIETLTRDATNRGRGVVVTGRSATLLAREVSSASSVEVLITGVESGAQKRITVNIAPGPSTIRRPINGQRSPASVRNGTEPRTEQPTTRQVASTAISRTQTTSEQVRDSVIDAINEGRNISAESISREISRR
jgi:hypothetical protein